MKKDTTNKKLEMMGMLYRTLMELEGIKVGVLGQLEFCNDQHISDIPLDSLKEELEYAVCSMESVSLEILQALGIPSAVVGQHDQEDVGT